MPLIELQKINKTYTTGSQQVQAVVDFDLRIEAGEFTVLAGPSGSGKTTVLNLIGCLDQPTSGRLILDGQEVSSKRSRDMADFRLHKLGFIFQSYNLIPVLTAAENAEFTLMLQHLSKTERRRRVQELFAELGLAGLEDRRPNDLSGGQQQRVAIARALLTEPKVILADEPTANLDSQTSSDLLDLMARLNREKGTTFVFSSHDPQVITRAHRIIRLRDGKLVADELPNRGH